MIRMLTKLDYKLKLMNVYDWAAKEKRSEKVAYLRSKVKGMTFDAEKQKRKSYFNFWSWDSDKFFFVRFWKCNTILNYI